MPNKAKRGTKNSLLKRVLDRLGPGFTTGASDDDPSGIATYAQAGALFGYNQLWTAFFTLPFMVAIQEMCGRIGLVTGRGLAGLLKDNYSKPVIFFAVAGLFLANTINVGADLGAMASSAQMLFGMPFGFWLILVTSAAVALQVSVPYPTYARFLKYLAFSLLAYVVTAFVVHQPWPEILRSIVFPQIEFKREFFTNVVAIFGTTISPYLFFWQSNQEVEEDIENHRIDSRGKAHIRPKEVQAMRLDTAIGMVFSNLVMFFIMVTSASTLHAKGIFSIETADQAALALRPFAGDFAYILFAFGIISTGMLAVPVLAGSVSYALADIFNKKAGLHYRFDQARFFYLVIALIMVIGLCVNFLPVPPFRLLYYAAVVNGLVAPPLMALIIMIGNNKSIMGQYVNSRLSNIVVSVMVFFMAAAAMALLINLV